MRKAWVALLLASVTVTPAVLANPTVTAAPVDAQRPPADAPYRNAKLPLETRVADLLARMTLEEKIAQITSVWDTKVEIQDAQDRFDPAKAKAKHPHGIGQLARPSDRKGPGSPRVIPPRSIADSIAYVNAVQKWAVEDTRLGIPVLFHEEALHGLAAQDATSYPQAIGLASTWDPDLIREINAAIAREVRARGVHLVLSPVVDVARDPRWGRIEETFGEDPFLCGEMGVASVRGLQGEGKELAPGKVFATLKHMTGHGQPQAGNNVAPALLGERELREAFFPPFRAVVERTGIAAVMPSYNEIDGVPSHANKWLIGDVLRGEWGFDGAIVSDYAGVEELHTFHKLAPDLGTAALLALRAGVDSDLPDGNAYRTITAEVQAGRIPMALLDRAVAHMLRLKFRSGMFEAGPTDAAAAARLTANPEARALALEAARKAITLLTNDGTLPLTAGAHRRVAVIGPNAAITRLGGYSSIPRTSVTLLDGIRAKLAGKAEVLHAQGVFITQDENRSTSDVKLADRARNLALIAEAAEVARTADVIILAIGDTEQTSREGWARTHLGDRTDIDIVGEQNELFDAMKATGKPVVVVALNGRPPSWPNIVANANAMLECWYLGQEGGTAMADALFGDVNPGGKMPVTVVREEGQIPFFYNHKPSARRGYLFADMSPLFPFGFGLSYTKFELSEPRLSAPRIGVAGTVTVEVDVVNVGDRAGDEVVQVYVHDQVASVTRPIKELKAFERVSLQPGERKTVRFTLGPEAFRMWDIDMNEVVEPGLFDVLAGPNSQDVKSVTLEIV